MILKMQTVAKKYISKILFVFFIFSGAASLSYQMLWLRKAMSYFGVITPVTSSVLCVFMLGIALGTWAAGSLTKKFNYRTLLKLYACAEFGIGLYAMAVPYLMQFGYNDLLVINSANSAIYLLWSWLVITLTLLPVCTLIGTTLPLLLGYMETLRDEQNHFGFLYFANLAGALLGCALPLGLIEIYGMHHTLLITAAVNILVGICAYILSSVETSFVEVPKKTAASLAPLHPKYKIILFLTGFMALGSEPVWIHSFTYVLLTSVYSFAIILGIYLYFNFVGTYFTTKSNYSAKQTGLPLAAILLPVSALLPIAFSSLTLMNRLGILSPFSISAVCVFLGYFLPSLINNICGNDAKKISIAYNYNLLGCILGPLVSAYILCPLWGNKFTLIFYAAVLLFIPFLLNVTRTLKIISILLFVFALIPTIILPSFEEQIEQLGVLHRDWIGFEGATGKGMDKNLFVNGVSMTFLTTDTKNMAHLAMAYRPQSKSMLIICFGMGTTLDSATKWPLSSITTVELSKGVVQSFGYFHSDADKVLADPRVHVVVDDGRRFLNRTHELYDVIILDPPPPINAAASGLLYSNEFIALAKSHLKPGGVLQHWIPYIAKKGERAVDYHAMLQSIRMQFPYIKLSKSLDGVGLHITASDRPLPNMTTDYLISNLPPAVIADIEEWKPNMSIQEIAQKMINPVDKKTILIPNAENIFMSDDKPYNEFTFLRSTGLYSPVTMHENK